MGPGATGAYPAETQNLFKPFRIPGYQLPQLQEGSRRSGLTPFRPVFSSNPGPH
jgi:hypothetical protein